MSCPSTDKGNTTLCMLHMASLLHASSSMPLEQSIFGTDQKRCNSVTPDQKSGRSTTNFYLVVNFNADRVILSRVQRFSHSTQVTLYPHARQNRLLFAKRQRGIFRLRVGCANTQSTYGIFSPVPQGPGQNECHTTTKSEMTASTKNQTQVSRSQDSTNRPFLTPLLFSLCAHFYMVANRLHPITQFMIKMACKQADMYMYVYGSLLLF